MSTINPNPEPVKVVINFFYSDDALLERAIDELCLYFGPADDRMEPVAFRHTDYYTQEMGPELKKVLVAFECLCKRDTLAEVKLITDRLERKLSTRFGDGIHRPVNIDPGFLYPEKFTLATGKNFPHRIYVGKGVYADLTLIFRHGRFEMLPWTYTDYLEHRVLDFLGSARERLLAELKQRREWATV